MPLDTLAFIAYVANNDTNDLQGNRVKKGSDKRREC